MCVEIPTLSGDFAERMRFIQCGQTYQAPCEYCGDLSRSDEWHQCEARTSAIMSGNESSYQAYRAKLGTRDNWTGD